MRGFLRPRTMGRSTHSWTDDRSELCLRRSRSWKYRPSWPVGFWRGRHRSFHDSFVNIRSRLEWGRLPKMRPLGLIKCRQGKACNVECALLIDHGMRYQNTRPLGRTRRFLSPIRLSLQEISMKDLKEDTAKTRASIVEAASLSFRKSGICETALNDF